MHLEGPVTNIREIGGEIWAEMQKLPSARDHWQLLNEVTDLVMAVLARHAGELLINDPDRPVKELPLGERALESE